MFHESHIYNLIVSRVFVVGKMKGVIWIRNDKVTVRMEFQIVTGSYYVTPAGQNSLCRTAELQPHSFCLPVPLECWNQTHVSACLALLFPIFLSLALSLTPTHTFSFLPISFLRHKDSHYIQDCTTT